MTTDDIGLTPIHLEWWWLNQHISLIGRIHVLATKISCYTAAALALHTLLSTGDVLGWTFFAHSLVWPAYQAGRGSPSWPQSRLSITNSNAIQSRLVTLLQRCFQFLQESQQLKGPESSTRTRHANKFLRSWIFLKPENRHWASFQHHILVSTSKILTLLKRSSVPHKFMHYTVNRKHLEVHVFSETNYRIKHISSSS